MDREAPARYRTPIGLVCLAKLRVKHRLLEKQDDQMEEEKNNGCVREQGRTAEEPCLAEEDSENAVVHRIPRVAVQTRDDEIPGWINRREGAFARSEEVPDTPEVDDGTGARE